MISEAEKTNIYAISEFMFFQYMLDMMVLGGRSDRRNGLPMKRLKAEPKGKNRLIRHSRVMDPMSAIRLQTGRSTTAVSWTVDIYNP